MDRRSIEPMVLNIKGADENAVRAVQQFIGEGGWEDAILFASAIGWRATQPWEKTMGLSPWMAAIFPSRAKNPLERSDNIVENWARGPTARPAFLLVTRAQRDTLCWMHGFTCLRCGSARNSMHDVGTGHFVLLSCRNNSPRINGS
jgi:hypothetical protein